MGAVRRIWLSGYLWRHCEWMKRVLPFAVLLWLSGCLHGYRTTTWRVGVDGELLGQHVHFCVEVAIVVDETQ